MAEHGHADALGADQNRILRMIAEGEPLPQVLDALTRVVERRSEKLACSILFVDQDKTGRRLRTVAAPSLPESYNQAVNGLAVCDTIGPCSTAAYLGKSMVVSDVATDFRWPFFHDLALSHGLRACWSTPIVANDGSVLGTFAMYYTEPRSPDERERGLIDVATSIARIAIERQRAEEALRESEEMVRLAMRGGRMGAWARDLSDDSVWWSAELEELFGLPSGSFGASADAFFELVHPEDRAAIATTVENAIAARTDYIVEFRFRHASGEWRWMDGRGRAVHGASGRPTVLYGIGMDITERKLSERQLLQHQRELLYQALHDALTGLPNRSFVQSRLAEALTSARGTGRPLALLYIDIDHFKNINDSQGHGAGDALLRIFAERLRQAVRPGDLIARMGGDEFVVLAEDLHGPDAAETIARRIMEALAAPLYSDSMRFAVTASIGVSVYPADGQDAETLLKHADIALYQAKESGRNGYQLFAAEMNARRMERMALEEALRAAIGTEQLYLEYQPIIDVATGSATSLEALLRWRHPQLGLISPACFIPVAEECGAIVELGQQVLWQVCRQLDAWKARGLPLMPVCINISVKQFERSSLQDLVAAAVRELEVDPALLVFEITESGVMQHVDQHLGTLRALRALGVGIAIDDFGTGYSSLSYLKHLPINTLKIDRAFIRDMASDEHDVAIIRAIIGMAHTLGLRTVAEGVETVEQLEELRRLGCDFAQGYYIRRPMSAEASRLWLEARRDGHTDSFAACG